MKLRALGSINSGKINAGDVFEINDKEGSRLLGLGVAEKAPIAKAPVAKIEESKPESGKKRAPRELPSREDLRKRNR